MLDFDISLVINIRMLAIVVIGSGLLTLITVSKEQSRKRIILRARINLIITGIATSFLGELYILATISDKENILHQTFQNFLPLFYAMLFILALDILPTKNTSVSQPNEDFRISEITLESLDLTKREKTVAMELLGSLSNKEIGEKLFISENTVKKHIQNILRKVDVKNRTEFAHLITLTKGDEFNDE